MSLFWSNHSFLWGKWENHLVSNYIEPKKLPSKRVGQAPNIHGKNRKAKNNSVSRSTPIKRRNHASMVGAKKHFLLGWSLLIKFHANSFIYRTNERFQTNAKIGSTFSPQAGKFQTKNTETDTSEEGPSVMLGVGCTAEAQVNADWARDPIQWAPALKALFSCRYCFDLYWDSTLGWSLDVSWADICAF